MPTPPAMFCGGPAFPAQRRLRWEWPSSSTGEYGCGLSGPEMAKICQYAENTYFGKPCGLLDQLTSAVGGVIFANFADPCAPEIEKIHAEGLLPEGVTLCVTDTQASHSELTGGIRGHSPGNGGCGGLSGPECAGAGAGNSILAGAAPAAHSMRDRAVLRAIHYYQGKRPGTGPEECPATRRLCGVSASHPGKWPFLV